MSAPQTDDQPVEEDRRGFYRGPGRGDGHRRRSLAWEEQRRVALTRPCEYVLVVPPLRGVRGLESRERRLPCGAEVGELCRDPSTGVELSRQAAHHIRIYPRIPQPPEEATP